MLTLQKMIDTLILHARIVYSLGEEELMPLCHAEGNGGHFAIGLVWGSPEEKTASLETLRQLFAHNQVKQYAIMAEAWMAEYDATRDLTVPPKKRMDRIEIISIAAADITGAQRMEAYRVERDAASGRPSVGAPMGDVSFVLGGRMLELLK